MTAEVDAVVAGGGVAGSTAAAALSALGWSVLVVEPGQHGDRRLGGEVIHPAGMAGLERLGLLPAAGLAEAAGLEGFAVFPEARTTGLVQLSYRPGDAAGPAALALDHGRISRALLGAAERLPGVTVARGRRVTGLAGEPGRPVVRLDGDGTAETLRCRLVVGADGAASFVRGAAGIRHRRDRSAAITGFLVDRAALPFPERGHIFTAAGLVLAYAIGDGRARVLFNQPLRHGRPSPAGLRAALDGLPPVLRAATAEAMGAGPGLRSVSSDVAVQAVARDRVVLVGDAAGSCHPVSASGMTMGIDDALRLHGTLRRTGGDLRLALPLYARERRQRQRARVLLATALHEVLGGAGPEMALMRAGLMRYWLESDRARTASMALLGMHDLRVRSVVSEFLRVAGSGLSAPFGDAPAGLRRARLMARIPRPMMRHVIGAMRVQ